MNLWTDWTVADRALASKEGWDLFDSSGSENGPVQIQSFDMPEEGEATLAGGDMEAWEIVWHGAARGIAHHVKALAILADENPIELASIRKWCEPC